MNTWDDSVRFIARTLSELARSNLEPRRRVADLDLDVALTARAAVLAGAAVVLGDLVPASGRAVPRRSNLLAVTERDPLHALGLVLRNRGRPDLTRSPSELLDAAAPGSPTTLRWAAVGRQAVIADSIWTSAPRALGGEHAWHVIGEVAALAELVAMVDADLAVAAADAARPDATLYLERTAGLRLASREVRSLAGGVPQSGADATATRTHPVIRAAESRGVIVPTNGEGAVHALRRLTTTLRNADVLTPQHARSTALVGRDVCILAAAAGASDPSGADLRRQLGDVAASLNAVVNSRHGEATLLIGNEPALEHQLRELAGYCRDALAGRAPRPRPEEATSIAARVPRLVTALTEQVHAQVAARRWAVPDRGEQRHQFYAVATSTGHGRDPRMFADLNRAVTAAEALRQSTTTSGPRVPVLAPSRAADSYLQEAIRGRERPRRPDHPAQQRNQRLPPSA